MMIGKSSYLHKRLLGYLTAAAMLLCLGTPVNAAMNFSEFQTGYQHPTQMRGLSATAITADMGAGWNLGNSLESENNETYWGNPRTTKSMIDAIAAKGFHTLRIPVRWDDNYSDPSHYTIRQDYMDRMETVVNYGLANNMYVIVNVHHNDLQKMVSADSWTQSRVKQELTAIWTQVSNRFKTYGDKLIFEVNNEPRYNEDWNGTATYYDCVNQYNEAGRSAIRATGGNNSSRLVMLPTYCASPDSAKIWGWHKLANDNMVAVSIHAYLPFNFAYEAQGHSNWTGEDYNSLAQTFHELDSAFLKKGVPIVIGEFGATNKGNTGDREKYAQIYATMAKQHGIPCVWWDNNSTGTGAEKFGIFDRSSKSFTFGGIADALVKVYGHNSSGDNIPGTSGISLFYGQASASNWGQAVSAVTKKAGGSFDAANLRAGGHFYVEYSGTKDQLELILQSCSGGQNWAKVSRTESGTANGHFFAEYSYNNCVAAFGTNNFAGLLDKIHVGATNHSITVYSLYYDYGGNMGTTLFWGNNGAHNWQQAVSIKTAKNGGSFNSAAMTQSGYFYLEYTGSEPVSLILQSWSGGNQWGKVTPYEKGYANGHAYLKFRYADCAAALWSNDFAEKLDMVHVQVQQNWTNVYLLCYCY